MVGRTVPHVLDPENLKAAPFHPKYVVASQAEDGDLVDLCPLLQVLKPKALVKVPDQVNEAKLREEIFQELNL